MIELQIERFDETARVLALKETAGERYLFLKFGEKEATEIGRAICHEPPLSDASRAQWMEMIEQREAVLDAIAITDLVDGVFKANVSLAQDGRSFDVPARPADAIAWAKRVGAPILASEDLMTVASLNLKPPRFASLFEDEKTLIPKDEAGSTLQTFFLKPFSFESSSWFIRVPPVPVILVMGLLTIASGVLIGILGVTEDIETGGELMPMLIAIIGLCLVVMYGIGRARNSIVRWRDNVRIEIHPLGLICEFNRGLSILPWSVFGATGREVRALKLSDGLLFANPPSRWNKGFSQHQFEPEWRQGEIGHYIRRYAPRLLGIESVDPEGGCPNF